MKKELIKEILNSGYKCCMIITGGGTGAITQLLQYGGGSKFLLHAEIPYSKNSFESLTDRNHDFVSISACDELVNAAIFNATIFSDTSESQDESPTSSPLIAVSCTAKLTYDGERENREHTAFIGVIRRENGTYPEKYFQVSFIPNLNREEQEKFLSESILAIMFMSVCNNTEYTMPSHIKEVQMENSDV